MGLRYLDGDSDLALLGGSRYRPGRLDLDSTRVTNAMFLRIRLVVV